GISRVAYAKRFSRSLEVDFNEPLRVLREREMLQDDGETIKPTTRGFELNNEIGLALVSV
ncbi:MAG: hypothetical protein IT367_10860, partial [Candidatus Hydrogenedentes bacterium]|nr:hypothetical protein [Candidatus Hydrogenedentota bacterium]